MLLTRSLPPQFLLPSWTGPELVLAVQRCYLSSTSTKRFKIKRQTYESIDSGNNLGEQSAADATDDAKAQKARAYAKRSHPDNPPPGIRDFKPHPPARPTPKASAAFYVGKRYDDVGPSSIAPNHEHLPQAVDSNTRQGGGGSDESFNIRWGVSIKEPIPARFKKVKENTPRRIGVGKGKGEWSWKPQMSEKPAFVQPTAHTQTELINSIAESLEQIEVLESPKLDMAGRWADPALPVPKTKSTDRLPWESEEAQSAVQMSKKSSKVTPIKIALKKRPPPSSNLVPIESRPKETMSLFEELFPEETKIRMEAVRRAEERLEKLPAFEWDLDEGFEQSWQAEREKQKAKLHAIPERRNLGHAPNKSRGSTDPLQDFSHKGEYAHTNKVAQARRHEPSVVILTGLSKHLEESDFFRVSPKGNHIQGWTSGIIKVIPAREQKTLETLGYYYILFSNDAAARAYMDNVRRLHTLGKTKGPSSMPFMPPPPGALKEGENIKDLLRGFSVVPRQNLLSMRLLNKPYRPGVLELIREGGIPALTTRAKGDALVLFSVDIGDITYFDILYALKEDGRVRNMHWKFAGGKDVDIINVSENKAPLNIGGEKPTYKLTTFKTPPKYIFAMKDAHEARRFVREWHCRPIEVAKQGQKDELGRERPAIVSAELLW